MQQRYEDLLPLVGEDMPVQDPAALELAIMSDYVIAYEKEHFPMENPRFPVGRSRAWRYRYKETCIAKITEAKENFQKEGNIESVNKLQSIVEQVSKKVFTEDTVEKDICNFIEISSIF